MDDYEVCWLFYMNKVCKVLFKFRILNKIMKGGVEIGILNVLMVGVNVGKLLGLCLLVVDYL